MIVGDPYKFAIGKAEIRAWNVDDAFSNGVLLFFVDGAIFPKEIVTAALNCEVRPLKERLGRLSAGRTLFAAPQGGCIPGALWPHLSAGYRNGQRLPL